ncbi:MAG: bifunctional RNase H/acid phosphatase [Candidatus Nanopelagicales bacterium]
MTRLIVEADGGSRGNPGPAAYGAVVKDAETGAVLDERADVIGVASNNVAEYRGLVAGLQAARDIDPDATVEVRMDSKLVVEQMSGRWQIKHPDMRLLAREARDVLPPGRVSYVWVPRDQNKHADRLLNAALDGGVAESGSARKPVGTARGWSDEVGTPVTLSLLRHGVTEHTVARRFSGSGGDDLPLSATGVAQARRAAEVVVGRGTVAAVVTSPLQRARQTAHELGIRLGLDPVVDDAWRECSFGAWDGLTYAEVAQRWPDELAAWRGSLEVAPPDGESLSAVATRVIEAREGLVQQWAGRHLVLVSHVTPIKVLVAEALGAPLASLFRMELAPASLTTVQWWPDGGASLRHFNDVSYLE